MTAPSIAIDARPGNPQVDFAVAEIRRALAGRPVGGPESGHAAVRRIVVAATAAESAAVAHDLGLRPPAAASAQAYAIRLDREAGIAAVLGADPVGAMYGGLDVAEAIPLGTIDQLADADCAPQVARRGIKFNIPLDARTPSYSDASDSAQQNIPEVWTWEFWEDYLETMARCRFNVLTLWNLHPFPSLVRVPEFPDVALADVMRTRTPFDTTFSLCGHDMVRPETLADLEVVKRMSMDEKIAFWRRVMQRAADRGIEVYLFTWNIFTFGADGKYGITHDQDNPQTIRYFRASVREAILTYPLLAGIGITAGERMVPRQDAFAKEKWLWNAYGEGIRDAKARQPNRHVRLIHRYHETALGEIVKEWGAYPDTLDLSFKYAVAHMYASPAPPFARSALDELPAHLRLWLTVRNDDIYSFRWGDPDFARAFVQALPGPDQLAGYYMGPDGYTWGREFIDAEPETPRQLVLRKQWYSFMLWGRLSFDPSLPNVHFQRLLSARFPQVDGAALYAALTEASRIIPLVTRCHWEDLDFQWFPEACISHPKYKGFHTVRHFVDGRSMPGSGVLGVREFIQAEATGKDIARTTPLEVAATLRAHADAAVAQSGMIAPGADKELRLWLGDIAAMAYLGRYYAAKIEGAVHLARLSRTADEAERERAVHALAEALQWWREYVAVAVRQYKPQLLTRLGRVDVADLTRKVEEDIGIARHWTAAENG